MALKYPALERKGFVLSELLGSGSYGSVFKARKSHGAREVAAIKIMDRTKMSTREGDNLVTEISLLKKLKEHPHIVHMIDFLYDQHNIYIIMEYCGGGDLSRFIKNRHNLPEKVCKRFLQQLASALKFLRDQNVAHFDLKPSNILLTAPSYNLKLADFGFAQKLMSGEEKCSIRGSPLYMAPSC